MPSVKRKALLLFLLPAPAPAPRVWAQAATLVGWVMRSTDKYFKGLTDRGGNKNEELKRDRMTIPPDTFCNGIEMLDFHPVQGWRKWIQVSTTSVNVMRGFCLLLTGSPFICCLGRHGRP